MQHFLVETKFPLLTFHSSRGKKHLKFLQIWVVGEEIWRKNYYYIVLRREWNVR